MNEESNTKREMSDLLAVRLEKLEALSEKGDNPFEVAKYDRTHSAQSIIDNFDAMEGAKVSIAGRVMSKRGMGKASFCDILDRSGKIQSYVRSDAIGESKYEDFKKIDIGDIVGICGEVFRTSKGEISIKANDYALLSKSMQPLPEKWHGLKDIDQRYRQRYVDLIVNPQTRYTFITRSKIIKAIREFLDNAGFLEVETPILNTIAGGAAARPFVTHHNTLDMDLFLRISPELYLKRLIVGGLEKVYELGRLFRNEGLSTRHNPEFTIIEIYEAYTDYEGMMDLCERLMAYTAKKAVGTTEVTYRGEKISLGAPFRRISMIEAVKEYSGVDFNELGSTEQAREIAKEKGIKDTEKLTKGEILAALFEEFAEEKLVQPTFVTGYPVEISPLAKRSKDDPMFTDRFELFITGREIANAFSELNDPFDQSKRFEDQVKKREAGDLEATAADNDYINALMYGLPPTGGMGIGIDRLCMLLTDSASIRDVLLFPTMRSVE